MANGDKTIGIVGLGIMGGAFAKNLVTAGFHVVGFDVDPAARRAARKASVEIASDAAAVARAAPVIITSLPNRARSPWLTSSRRGRRSRTPATSR